MKITDVRAVQPVSPESPPDWRTSMGQILVAVDVDSGPTGYGVGGGGAAGIHIIRSVLRDLLVGADAREIGLRWRDMYDATLPFGRKGVAIMALSGVDLALWDLRGKFEGKPVVELLGGEVRLEIPTYQTLWSDATEADAATNQALKFHVDDPDEAVETVRRARELLGPDCEIMVDAWMRWNVGTTLDFAERVNEYDVAWIEEPLPADDLEAYATLVERSPIPIAGGEHEFTAAGFRPLIENRLHDVVQPDVCWCGGMTELVAIYSLANEHGVRVCPHRGAEVWGLHAIAALDPQPLVESVRPWMTWVGGQPAIENGVIRLTDAPGFGVEFDAALWRDA